MISFVCPGRSDNAAAPDGGSSKDLKAGAEQGRRQLMHVVARFNMQLAVD